MTVKQGEYINQLYISYHDSISQYKDSLTIKTFKYDSLFNKNSQEKDSIYNWRWKYEANRATYTDWQKDFRKINKIHEISKIVLVGIILLQFNTISNLQK